jgi:multidrug transporter EmrE-like cation transporter
MAISLQSAALFFTSIVFQVLALLLLPLSRGFTAWAPTLGCLALFAVGLGLLARLAHSGIELGTLIPLSSASVPLATMVVAILFYGESASPLKVVLLLVACALIGVASAKIA